MICTYALRNILRNRKRSVLTATVIFGAALVVGMAQSWINGMMDLYIDNMITYQTGHIKITTTEYASRERFLPLYTNITNSPELVQLIQKKNPNFSVEERISFSLILTNKGKTMSSRGIALDVNNNHFDLRKKLVKGAISRSTDTIYPGVQLATRLGLHVGDTILIATETAEGGLNARTFTVAGIYRFTVTAYDNNTFILPLEGGRSLLRMENAATEIYLFGEKGHVKDAMTGIKQLVDPSLAVRDYQELLGDFYQMMTSAKTGYLIVELIIMLVGSFVIINTMMMSILERMREFGTLRALGMSDGQLFRLLVLEGTLIGVAGGVPGALLGSAIVAYFSIDGLNFETAFSGVDMAVEYVLKPSVTILHPVIAVLISVMIPAIASMLPARIIRRYTPASSLKM